MKVQEVISRVNNGAFNCIFHAEEEPFLEKLRKLLIISIWTNTVGT